MPFVTVTQMEGALSAEQKKAMIEKITEAILAVEGERVRPLTVVMIQETLKPGGVGVGGVILGAKAQGA